MLHFATLFDINYLTRGLALYSSMQKHIESFILYVLALDQEVVNYIEKKNETNLKVIKLSDVEKKYPELIAAKNNRSIVEYYFTLSPVLPLYMLQNFPELEFITTLDADIFFFSNPKPIFEEFENYSILITKHDFAENIGFKIKYGKYNVSFQSFRNDKEGLNCLKSWKIQCIDWCYDKLEDGKFADQKYLDTWTSEYKNVLEIAGNGAGIAPWNISKYTISSKNKTIYCNNDKLIFYHFHGLRFISSSIILHHLEEYNALLTKNLKKYLYQRYIIKINKQMLSADKTVIRYNKKTNKKEVVKLLLNSNAIFLLFNSFVIDIGKMYIVNFLKQIYKFRK